MQQPATSDSDIRAAIDRAAREVAWESGLSAVTLRRVASRARLDPGTVARVEPSMTVLAARMFRQIVAKELEAVSAGASLCMTAVDALWFVVDAATANSEGNDDWMWAEAWSVGARNPRVAEAVRDINQVWTEFVAALIDGGVRSGEFATVDSLFVARTFLALVDGSGVRSVFGGDLPDMRTRLVQAFLADALGLEVPGP